ncbi:MAG: 50S ribosomal protein L6 [bacterium]
MSKLARKPLKLPPKVTAKLESNVIKIQGPKGMLQRDIPKELEINITAEGILVKRKNDEKPVRMLQGTYTSLINNMIKGVTEGFKKELELVGVGYKADIKNNNLILNVGYTNPVTVVIPPDLSIKVEEKQTRLVLTGMDKDKVGLYAMKIRNIRPPDAYKGKGIKFVDEVLKLKPGKSAAGATSAGAGGK